MTTPVFETALAVIDRLDLAVVERATIVLVIGLTAVALASRARASVRHLLIASMFGTVLVLPLVMSTVPSLIIELPVRIREAGGRLISNPVSDGVVAANSVERKDDTSSRIRSLPSFTSLLRSVWASGAALLLVLLVIDLRRLRALRRGGLPWLGKKDLIRSLAVTSGVRRPVDVLLHEGIRAPLTCGLRRPVILLPVDANDWPEADLRRALVHELEHVRRGDWVTQLFARAVCACYWFHPLVWMAWRRFVLEAERACDDAVVECAESTQYAEQLVSLARRLSNARTLPSLAMANRSDLSARVAALLDGTRRRGRVGYGATAGITSAAAVVLLLVACVRASTTAPTARVSGVAPEIDQPSLPGREEVQRPVSRLNARRSTSQSALQPVGERPAGYRVGSAQRLADLRDVGVTDDFIRGLTDLGYTNLSVDDLLSLRHHGVTPDFILSLRRVGFTDLTTDQLLAARDHGVSESFIQDFRDLGYTNLTLPDFIGLWDQGVTADFARRQRSLDGSLVSVNELIVRRVRGDR